MLSRKITEKNKEEETTIIDVSVSTKLQIVERHHLETFLLSRLRWFVGTNWDGIFFIEKFFSERIEEYSESLNSQNNSSVLLRKKFLLLQPKEVGS